MLRGRRGEAQAPRPREPLRIPRPALRFPRRLWTEETRSALGCGGAGGAECRLWAARLACTKM